MEDDLKKYETSLKYLCTDMIYLLDQLKNNNLIDEEEYEKQTREKKKFINNIK